MGFVPDSSSNAPAPVVQPSSGSGRFVPDLDMSNVTDASGQPNQRSDRFTLKSSQPDPNSTYNYGDAIEDTGKTVVNSIANLGENTINTIKNIPQIPGQVANAVMHPIKTARDISDSVGNKINEYNSMDKLANKVSTDPIGFGSDVVGAGMLAEGIKAPVQAGAKVVSDAATNTGRYFSRIGNTFKPTAIENLNVSNSERIGNLASTAKSSANSDIQPIQKSIDDVKAQTDRTLGSIKESRIVLRKNLGGLKDDLQDAAEKGSVDFQKKLPDFFNANSEAYGNARDNAFAQMTKEGKGITNQEVFDAIQKTKQNISDALIPSDAPALKIIRQLESKYDPSESVENSPILGQNGQPISSTIKSKGGNFVNLDQLVQDLRNVKSTLSSGAAAGRTGFNQEDLAVNYLNHNLGDYIKEKIPAFAQLQKDYSPVMQAMKEAHKIFKPNMGEFNTKTATTFLKNAGTGKLELGQEKVLDAVEGGNKFAPGVGNISAEVKGIGKSMDDIKDQMSKFDDQSRNITGNSNAEIAQKQASISTRKAILQKRLDGLEQRRQTVSRLEANRDVVGRLKDAVLGKAADVAGVGGIHRMIR